MRKTLDFAILALIVAGISAFVAPIRAKTHCDAAAALVTGLKKLELSGVGVASSVKIKSDCQVIETTLTLDTATLDRGKEALQADVARALDLQVPAIHIKKFPPATAGRLLQVGPQTGMEKTKDGVTEVTMVDMTVSVYGYFGLCFVKYDIEDKKYNDGTGNNAELYGRIGLANVNGAVIECNTDLVTGPQKNFNPHGNWEDGTTCVTTKPAKFDDDDDEDSDEFLGKSVSNEYSTTVYSTEGGGSMGGLPMCDQACRYPEAGCSVQQKDENDVCRRCQIVEFQTDARATKLEVKTGLYEYDGRSDGSKTTSDLVCEIANYDLAPESYYDVDGVPTTLTRSCDSEEKGTLTYTLLAVYLPEYY